MCAGKSVIVAPTVMHQGMKSRRRSRFGKGVGAGDETASWVAVVGGAECGLRIVASVFGAGNGS